MLQSSGVQLCRYGLSRPRSNYLQYILCSGVIHCSGAMQSSRQQKWLKVASKQMRGSITFGWGTPLASFPGLPTIQFWSLAVCEMPSLSHYLYFPLLFSRLYFSPFSLTLTSDCQVWSMLISEPHVPRASRSPHFSTSMGSSLVNSDGHQLWIYIQFRMVFSPATAL